jgi:hypothetical protein
MRRFVAAFAVALQIALGVGIAACGHAEDSCGDLNDCVVQSDGAAVLLDGRAVTTDGSGVDEDGAVGEGGAGSDASVPDATLDAAEPLDATLGEDAQFDAGIDGGQPDSSPACTSEEKVCGSGCVAVSSPNTGCGESTCSPCDLSNATPECAVREGSGARSLEAAAARRGSRRHESHPRRALLARA